ncbi:hypothetical protein JCM8208_005434 [Rhodotorula glutinis]
MLRRAKELAERIAAEEDAERAASASAPAREETAAGDEAVEAPSAAAPVVEDAAHGESTAVEASASAPVATEPLEDGVDEEIDVEATLRLKRSSSAAAPARPSTVPVKEEERAEREEAVEEREEVASEAGTEEFLVV